MPILGSRDADPQALERDMKPTKTDLSMLGPRYDWEVHVAEHYDSGWSRFYVVAVLASYVAFWRVRAQRAILNGLINGTLKLQARWHVLDNKKRIIRWYDP